MHDLLFPQYLQAVHLSRFLIASKTSRWTKSERESFDSNEITATDDFNSESFVLNTREYRSPLCLVLVNHKKDLIMLRTVFLQRKELTRTVTQNS